MNDINNQFQFVICGTDTYIGKTIISSFFVRGLNSFYWKPIQSGIESETDSQAVERIAKVKKTKIIQCHINMMVTLLLPKAQQKLY